MNYIPLKLPTRKQAITISALTLIAFYFISPKAVNVISINNIDAKREAKLSENRKAVEFFKNRNNLVNVLSVLAAVPPASPPSPLCTAPPLPPAHCDDPGLGELLPSPRNLVTMILFSFEVDTLEIALKEMEDIVDVIFLVEATKSHKGVHDI